ncbi:uncharacterized protein TrAtP1_006224 [Trichoderma atroviride]|uniref:uncharacterized protein n=1 Tax=Hypocrea atroviridis TaxID=63577 RepID=UPI00331CCBA7|nr:hypothetical protein TrAtP1_006224 [Trichoderma atroviride]
MPSSMAQSWARLPLALERTFNKLTGSFVRKPFADRFLMTSHHLPQHPPVFCVVDLLYPPPQYQQRRSALPVVGELEILQAELYRCQSQSSFGNDVERELLDADAEHLSQWIEHLENLVYMEAATTIPSRYQQECTAVRMFKRAFKRNKTRQP